VKSNTQQFDIVCTDVITNVKTVVGTCVISHEIILSEIPFEIKASLICRGQTLNLKTMFASGSFSITSIATPDKLLGALFTSANTDVDFINDQRVSIYQTWTDAVDTVECKSMYVSIG
jgi:hypothetical protein